MKLAINQRKRIREGSRLPGDYINATKNRSIMKSKRQFKNALRQVTMKTQFLLGCSKTGCRPTGSGYAERCLNHIISTLEHRNHRTRGAKSSHGRTRCAALRHRSGSHCCLRWRQQWRKSVPNLSPFPRDGKRRTSSAHIGGKGDRKQRRLRCRQGSPANFIRYMMQSCRREDCLTAAVFCTCFIITKVIIRKWPYRKSGYMGLFLCKYRGFFVRDRSLSHDWQEFLISSRSAFSPLRVA